ncbi:hypothetical protein EI165_00155 [Pseudoalteromonas nigrifaciens]|uniref:hypothetical protein n=1 Tax=Pseudoalteromonas nigrifaciens TaxID=28109 RepID=UPI0017888554|nr:hypothetical protein [Pseudoalteromonas nigrifaciens]MBE0418531.1 hypothetical protein [Pseudoalteromonas nigrifaciens]
MSGNKAFTVLKRYSAAALALYVFLYVGSCAQQLDEARENVCKEKGMVLVTARGKDYCTYGTRDGL